MEIKKITYNDTKEFILGIHYARRMPCIQYAYGLFDKEKLIGVVTYGQPASPSLCKGVAGIENKKNVLELNRLVVLPEYNSKNCASFLVGRSLKMLPNNTYVVSYADWGGGGDTSDMYTKRQTGYTQDLPNHVLTSIQKEVIQGIMLKPKQEGN